MFITFEGIDGCGKTTQIKILQEFLLNEGHQVLAIREPGGTSFSEKIREILLYSKHDINSISELMLFEAARADLIEKVIKPELEAGKIILSDRFYDSTTAYQGYGRGIDIASINAVNNLAAFGISPDITFYFHVPIEVSRARTNHKRADRMESSSDEYFEKVINGFVELSKIHSDRFIQIDALKSIEEISEIIKKIVLEKFK